MAPLLCCFEGNMEGKKDNRTKGLIIAAVSETIFGTSFIFIRKIVASVTVMTLLSWRNIIGFLTINLLVLMRVIKVDFKGKNLKPLLLLCSFQPISYYIFETISVKMTTASEAGMFLAATPIITMIFSALFIKDRPSGRQVLFMCITVSGGLLAAAAGGLSASGNLTGYFLLLLAMCSESAFAVTSQITDQFTSVEKTYVQTCAGTVVFTICAIVEQTAAGTLKDSAMLIFTDRTFLVCVLCLALGCNVIGFFMANYALVAIGATRRAAFGGLGTITAILGGVLILGESFSAIQIVATILILTGVYGVNFGSKARTKIHTK